MPLPVLVACNKARLRANGIALCRQIASHEAIVQCSTLNQFSHAHRTSRTLLMPPAKLHRTFGKVLARFLGVCAWGKAQESNEIRRGDHHSLGFCCCWLCGEAPDEVGPSRQARPCARRSANGSGNCPAPGIGFFSRELKRAVR